MKKLGIDIQRQQAENACLTELRTGIEHAEDQIFQAAGIVRKPRQ